MVSNKDPGKLHFYFSIAKSLIRIVGCVFLMMGLIVLAGGLLLFAELLGIAEEL